MHPYQRFINGLEVQTKYIHWEFTFSTVIRFEKQTPMGIYRDMDCQLDFVRHLLLECSRGCTRQCLYLNLGNPRSNITPDSLYSSCLNLTLVRKTNPNDTNTVTKPKKHNVLLDLRSTRDSLLGTDRQDLTLTGYGTYTYTFQTKSPTCPANIGRDSCEVYTSLPLSAITYWIMHAHYFALIT